MNLVNKELKSDGGYGKVNINRATLDAKNITSLPSDEMLTVNADAHIENKAHANLSLSYSLTPTGQVLPHNDIFIPRPGY